MARKSVVDPNTLNLDPDPGFWPNLDPDPGPDPGSRVILSNWKEKRKYNFRGKKFYFLTTIRTKCHKKFLLS